jgi:hypothetical protein
MTVFRVQGVVVVHRFDWGNDQEIEFHEIEIGIFHEIKSFYKLLQNCSGDRKGPKGSLFQGFFSDLT